MKLYSSAILLLSAACAAQQTAAPTPETVGDYTYSASFETGYRIQTIGGSDAEYRSQVNFGNGVKLLSSSMAMYSKDGHGRWFDEILLSTQGLGGDPYESATFRIRKNRWYRYDLLWRRNDYFNPGLVTDGASGSNLLNTEFDSQNHDLTLLPQSKIQFFLGYTRDSQSGTGMTTATISDSESSPVFPVIANIRVLRSEYRVGNQIRWRKLRLTWTRGWEDFKDDGDSPVAGAVAITAAGGVATLNPFSLTQPYHGTSPYWRAGLFYEHRWLSVNGRFSYTAGRRHFLFNQSSAGFGGLTSVATFGTADRPVATGNLTISAQPGQKLTVVNQTSIYNVRTEGNSAYAAIDNSTQTAQYIYFSYLGIFTLANETNLNYRASRWLSVHAGYQYTDRHIRSIQQTVFAGAPQHVFEQTNILNSGFGGVRLNPLKGLTFTADGEVGWANHPFAPKSDQGYHTIAGQVQYQHKTLRLSAVSRTDYETNSTALTAYSSQSRVNSASATWSPLAWLSWDASYSKLHLNTLGGIAYFAGSQLNSGQSYYLSNIHSGNFGLRVAAKKLATFYVGYSIVQDTGDGRSNPLSSGAGAGLPTLAAAQTYPMRYQTPLARVSIRLAEKLRANVGYQWYGFRDDFYNQQGYRSNTGYVSLLWSF